MATRLYLPSTAETPGISPTPSTDWEDTSAYFRFVLRTTKRLTATTDIDFPNDGDATSKDILFALGVAKLTAGQTVTGGQAIKMQIRGRQFLADNNMFSALGIRVMAGDATTVRKVVLAVTRDDVELSAANIPNRSFTATSAATNYTTVTDDYLEISVGTGGDPAVGNSHNTRLRFGDDDAGDLPEDDTTGGGDTTDPWVELADTLTFETTRPAIIGGGIGCDTWVIGA